MSIPTHCRLLYFSPSLSSLHLKSAHDEINLMNVVVSSCLQGAFFSAAAVMFIGVTCKINWNYVKKNYMSLVGSLWHINVFRKSTEFNGTSTLCVVAAMNKFENWCTATAKWVSITWNPLSLRVLAIIARGWMHENMWMWLAPWKWKLICRKRKFISLVVNFRCFYVHVKFSVLYQ